MIALVALGLTTAACGSVDTVSRNRPIEASLAPMTAPVASSYRVTDLQVVVPASLRVSEANRYYPITDIVWRGDPLGDRHDQVAALFTEAAQRGALTMQGDRAVVAEVVLQRFHGVTEKTRYSVGGVYNIEFTLTVRDAETGAVIDGPRFVEADLPAPGGNAAVALEQSGQTEKVRVTDFLTMVLMRELSGQSTPI